MKLICLKDYIKLFIKERFIKIKEKSNPSCIITIEFVDFNGDNQCSIDYSVDFAPSSNNIKLELTSVVNENMSNVLESRLKLNLFKTCNILKFPVKNVQAKIFNFHNVVNIIDLDVADFKNDIDINYIPSIHPDIGELKSFCDNPSYFYRIKFICQVLPLYCLNNFLFKEGILEIHFLNMLCKYENTVLSVSKYNKAIEYILKNVFKFKNDYPHKILEKNIASVVNSMIKENYGKHKCFKIEYCPDRYYPCYIIKSTKNNVKNIL